MKKQMYYNGITYFLPIIDGKAKRFKGKMAKLFIGKQYGNDFNFEIAKLAFKAIGDNYSNSSIKIKNFIKNEK